MSIDPRQPWFGRKRFGWGWTPRTWQGWGVVALFVLLSLLGIHPLVEREHGVAALIYQLLLVIGLIVICAAKGESLSGRRGSK
jgi:hypothetical protein